MALVQPDLEMDPDQRLGVEIRPEAGHAALVGRDQFLRDALAHRRVIGLARHIDDGGDKPVELVLPHEQTRARPANQVQRADDDRMQDLG